MTDSITPQHWTLLRSMRPQSEDALATIAISIQGSETSLSAALDQAGHLHLLIPVVHGPVGNPPSDLNGLKVRHRSLAIGEVLDLSAPSSHEQVFTPFCAEVIDAVVLQLRDPWKAVAAIVRAWQSAWKPMRQAMDKITQVGLFGELLVLRSLMIPALGAVAVDQWSGPDSERHDFVGEHLHIEVKTTRKSRAEHEISRLDQLRVPTGRQLLFVSLQLDESASGDESLATQIDAVIELLRSDAAALDLFMAKLTNVGWSDELRSSGELLRFFTRTEEIFAVDGDFPRLPDDFELPSGVVSVKYTVNLANLPSLDIDEVIEIIKDANQLNECG
ncbi:PD-(D/E)XK motif protein [Duganella sp. FT92W]|uniref:PD-(D/E)XK motif protein n=1 Tax=Pseudoduganella rivuli TaxID=2666085 RepID=A0A7X2LXU9_9BURK|nr:PD-(D/E)XK motif protein [Pseudoduganella rivuli]MRV76304.1 PD-(D/E)XK motif protein [Pseudoduganella rivuli]